jgi:hypothetical protein
MFSNIFFFFENRAVCEIMSKNMIRAATKNVITWRIRVACWISKATRTRMYTPTRPHTTQICDIYCFSTATKIRERASMLRYTYTVLFVNSHHHNY